MEGGKRALAGDAKKEGKNVNPVQHMMIQEEIIHKEVAFQRTQAQREYTINPFTMALVSEKPNHVTPKDPFKTQKQSDKAKEVPLNDDVVDRAFRLEAMRRKIQSAAMQPRQKYPFAQTSSQEVGWNATPLIKKSQISKDLWTFNRKKTPITGYAEEYVTLTKLNPFAVKDR